MKNLLFIFLFTKLLFSQNLDYSNLNNWAAHPNKKDFSDSIPLPFANQKIDGRADVFYIYPTLYDDSYKFEKWNATLDNIELLNEVDLRPILFQASAFNIAGPVFAPRYRQAHLDAYDIVNKNEKDSIFNFAYQDVKNAFVYYLENFNNGRPIIIASHSQGTNHAGRLLKEFFENKPLKEKLIAAYVIGLIIPENYFSDLKPCRDSNEINCFVGWRTFKKDYLPTWVKNEKIKSIVTNPLTWKIDNNNFGDEKLHLGAILFDFNKNLPNFCEAEIHDNVLWVSKFNIWWSWFYFSKNFHAGDINIFYGNIRQNVLNRINNYYKTK